MRTIQHVIEELINTFILPTEAESIESSASKIVTEIHVYKSI